MSLERQIRESLAKHAHDAHTNSTAWTETRHRIAREHRRRIVLSAASLAAVAVALVVTVPRIGTDAPRPRPPVVSPSAPEALSLRVTETLRGTSSEIFTGELAFDPGRKVLFAGEQHDLGNSGVELRVRVVDAATFRTVRYLGPGILRAVDPRRGFAFLDVGVGTETRTISVVKVDSGEQVANLPQDAGGIPPALDVQNGRLFVVRTSGIDVYDLQTLALERRLPIPNTTDSIAVSEAGDILYVSQQNPLSVLLLDSRTGRALRTLTGFDSPTKGAPLLAAGSGWLTTNVGDWRQSTLSLFMPDGTRLWRQQFPRAVGGVVGKEHSLLFNSLHDLTSSEFTSPGDPPDVVEVRFLPTGKFLGSIEVPDGPVSLAIDAERRLVYVTCLLGNSVVTISY